VGCWLDRRLYKACGAEDAPLTTGRTERGSAPKSTLLACAFGTVLWLAAVSGGVASFRLCRDSGSRMKMDFTTVALSLTGVCVWFPGCLKRTALGVEQSKAMMAGFHRLWAAGRGAGAEHGPIYPAFVLTPGPSRWMVGNRRVTQVEGARERKGVDEPVLESTGTGPTGRGTKRRKVDEMEGNGGAFLSQSLPRLQVLPSFRLARLARPGSVTARIGAGRAWSLIPLILRLPTASPAMEKMLE
jgi:hypothetical protein